MVFTYYIKLSRTGADRHNGILMSLLLLVAETNIMFVREEKEVSDKPWQNMLHDKTIPS